MPHAGLALTVHHGSVAGSLRDNAEWRRMTAFLAAHPACQISTDELGGWHCWAPLSATDAARYDSGGVETVRRSLRALLDTLAARYSRPG